MKTIFEFDYKKATQAINYLAIQAGGQIDKLKLIKLVYLAERYHLRRHGRPIFNDTYYAMPLGPVASSVKDIAEFSDFLADEEKNYAEAALQKGTQPHSILSLAEVDTDVFSDSELEALDFAFSEFGNYTPFQLVDITHIYPEWKQFEAVLNSKETTREVMSYADFFKNPEPGSEDKFALREEILAASQAMFEEECSIAERWK